MELHQIAAKIEMEDKSMVNLTSNSGSYDMKSEMLTLVDNVHIVSSTGYEARLREATIEVRKGHVLSEKPVWVKLTNGVINAKQLEIRRQRRRHPFRRRRNDDRAAGAGQWADKRAMKRHSIMPYHRLDDQPFLRCSYHLGSA